MLLGLDASRPISESLSVLSLAHQRNNAATDIRITVLAAADWAAGLCRRHDRDRGGLRHRIVGSRGESEGSVYFVYFLAIVACSRFEPSLDDMLLIEINLLPRSIKLGLPCV